MLALEVHSRSSNFKCGLRFPHVSINYGLQQLYSCIIPVKMHRWSLRQHIRKRRVGEASRQSEPLSTV